MTRLGKGRGIMSSLKAPPQHHGTSFATKSRGGLSAPPVGAASRCVCAGLDAARAARAAGGGRAARAVAAHAARAPRLPLAARAVAAPAPPGAAQVVVHVRQHRALGSSLVEQVSPTGRWRPLPRAVVCHCLLCRARVYARSLCVVSLCVAPPLFLSRSRCRPLAHGLHSCWAVHSNPVPPLFPVSCARLRRRATLRLCAPCWW